MAGVLKKTTGLTGLKVEPRPHKILTALYNRILLSLESAPKEAAYRQHTEALIKRNLEYVLTVKDIGKLEEKLGYQVEESIKLAENELMLARRMAQWKPWLPLETKPSADQWKWPL
ncbi:NADH dehydrogenase [ubiquinone] 1 alpha subcomplex subunit 5 [Galendromus occidentalis]|uniref:NADH dehydrogenase [ubiquinone] 1 alpha subcomplex subunit 5 n=1 Tax=Galendromus occidentalis TaxID=34638 RepID=A0AAJ6QW45_9ACAR|nr:NADH dehydrogenase [ubiquinone] 1 alpha subcomplex subunit 5 [Galendromus occidentalis]